MRYQEDYMNSTSRKLKRIRESAAARTMALLVLLFYIINVQSIDKDVPRQMARNDELYTESVDEVI